ncbi:MAG TPA: DUF3307 domain-containing protein [Puia sp.]|nr:DUF3307 domain-containing protein [Puia sp.]
MIQSVWLTKLILAHLVTDFILQPKSWVTERTEKHFASPRLYLHGLVTALFAWLMIGPAYWTIALVIFITHILIDGWKSYQQPTLGYFVMDQCLHLLVIVGCWYALFIQWPDVRNTWHQLRDQATLWKSVTAIVFLTTPAGILIGKLTEKWRVQLSDSEGLANAGKWIGMIERLIILVFVVYNQYAAIGLLVAAKGIIRFNEKDRPEIKTEYLVIGTLLSIGIAIMTGVAIKL